MLVTQLERGSRCLRSVTPKAYPAPAADARPGAAYPDQRSVAGRGRVQPNARSACASLSSTAVFTAGVTNMLMSAPL